ncbi:MAG: serine/threonine protein kinase, partial [Acidimicrobiia bacterium]
MAGTSAPDIPDCRDLSPVGDHVARTVYAAWHDALDRPVTVTVYPPLEGPDDRDRFEGAAAAAQRLGVHPSVLTLYAWGVGDTGAPWIVTDRFEPDPADRLLRRDGPFEIARALEIGVLLAGAVESAHRSGIVHGDISPSQIVFAPHGEALLSETGLTRFARLTGIEAVMAPIRYHAPPEVLEGTATSAATDIYSLASAIYALLVGRAPHEKSAEITDSNASLLLRILQLGVPAIERPGLPPGLDEALRAAMAPQPGQRTQSAGELARALQDAQRRGGLDATEPVVLDEADLDRLASTRAPRAGSTPDNRPLAPPTAPSAGIPMRSPGEPAADGPDGPAATRGWTPEGTPGAPAPLGGAPGAVPADEVPSAGPPADAPADPSLPVAPTGSIRPADLSGGAPASPAWLPAGESPPPADLSGGAPASPAWLPAGESPPPADPVERAGPSPAAPPGAPLWQWAAPDADPPAAPSGPPGGHELPAWFTDPLPNRPGGAAPPSHLDRPAAPPPPSAPGASGPPAWGPDRRSREVPWAQGPT